MIEAILELIRFFRPRVSDRTILDELERHALDRTLWRSCHQLFQSIRAKTLEEERKAEPDALRYRQYLFEELIAKVLYNCKQPDDAFKPDVAFQILPQALALADAMGVEEPLSISAVTRPYLRQST